MYSLKMSLSNMNPILSFVALLILPLVFLVSVSAESEVFKKCAHLKKQCNETLPCCLGICKLGICNDEMSHSNTRGLGGDFDYIEHELETGDKVDVSRHKNINLLSPLDECGISGTDRKVIPRRKKRIVGGSVVQFGAYPWLVQLYYHNITYGQDIFTCGGTLINKRTVMTAAHCVTRVTVALTLQSVIIGNNDRRKETECDENNSTCKMSQKRDVIEIITHENYSDGNLRNDIALLKLDRDVELTPFVRPICLPTSEKYFKKWNNGKFKSVGWGTQNKFSDLGPLFTSHKAQEVENNLVGRSSCDRFFTRMIGKLSRHQLCAGGYPGKGDCAGDSGGPLLRKTTIPGTTDEKYVQFGIVSSGAVVKCGYQGKPSVYTNVMAYLPWILDNIGNSSEERLLDLNSILKNQRTREEAPDLNLSLKTNPEEEIGTGLDIDVTSHKNIALLPKFPDCGKSNRSDSHHRVKRVVGGLPTGIGTMPWLVQVYVRNGVTLELYLRCSGTIITSRHVLTTASCLYDISTPFNLDSVVLGNYNRREMEKECIGKECFAAENVLIEEIFIHDEYAKHSLEMDIAILKLAETIQFNKFIYPVCLPLREDFTKLMTNDKFSTLGWGKTSADANSTTNLLRSAYVHLNKRQSCTAVYSRRFGPMDRSRFLYVCMLQSILILSQILEESIGLSGVVSNSLTDGVNCIIAGNSFGTGTICAGGEAGVGECTGDLGNPLQKLITNSGDKNLTRYYQFGIASVIECASQGLPTVYTNVLYHMPWILDHIGE